MKRVLIIILVSLVLTPLLNAAKEIRLTEKDIYYLEDILEEKEIFFKSLKGLDHDENGHLYYLAGELMSILKVDVNTFKLVKTIACKGQGPGEFLRPVGLRVKNNKVYVLDFFFPGIKIYDLDGKVIKEFKTTLNLLSFTTAVNKVIDVNSNNEIFIRQIDDASNSSIAVYSYEGQKIRQIIPLETTQADDLEKWVLKSTMEFVIDSEDNIIVLYLKEGNLKKFSDSGKLIWKKNLYEVLPKELRKKNKFIVKQNKKQFVSRFNLDFVDLCLIESDGIFVSGVKTGIVFAKNGDLLCFVRRPKDVGMGNPVTYLNGKLYASEKIFNFEKLRGLK